MCPSCKMPTLILDELGTSHGPYFHIGLLYVTEEWTWPTQRDRKLWLAGIAQHNFKIHNMDFEFLSQPSQFPLHLYNMENKFNYFCSETLHRRERFSCYLHWDALSWVHSLQQKVKLLKLVAMGLFHLDLAFKTISSCDYKSCPKTFPTKGMVSFVLSRDRFQCHRDCLHFQNEVSKFVPPFSKKNISFFPSNLGTIWGKHNPDEL